MGPGFKFGSFAGSGAAYLNRKDYVNTLKPKSRPALPLKAPHG